MINIQTCTETAIDTIIDAAIDASVETPIETCADISVDDYFSYSGGCYCYRSTVVYRLHRNCAAECHER